MWEIGVRYAYAYALSTHYCTHYTRQVHSTASRGRGQSAMAALRMTCAAALTVTVTTVEFSFPAPGTSPIDGWRSGGFATCPKGK